MASAVLEDKDLDETTLLTNAANNLSAIPNHAYDVVLVTEGVGA